MSSLSTSLAQSAEHRRWWVLAVLCLSIFLVVVDNTVVNVALPSLARDLHASNTSLQWIVAGYSLPLAGLLLAGSALGDRLGRKRVMMVALAEFGTFSLLAAHAKTVPEILLARALMGMSAAFIFPSTLSLITSTFSDLRERALAFGIWGGVAGVAIALGPILGGALITHFWFGSIFLVNVPIALVAVVCTWAIVPESRLANPPKMDYGGLALGTTGVTLLVLAIIQGPSWGWHSAAVLSLFGVASVLIVTFVRYELSRRHPLLDVRVFRQGMFSAGAIAISVSFFCLFGFIFLITQYLQMVKGYSALSAGVHTLPFAVVVMVATPLGAMAGSKLGPRPVVSAGLAIMAVGLAWSGALSPDSSYFGQLVWVMAVLGVGFSLIRAPSTAGLMGVLPVDQVGSGAAVNETTRELGGTLGVAVVGSVFASVFGPQVHRALSTFGLSTYQVASAQGSMPSAIAAVSHLPLATRLDAESVVVAAFMNGLHRGCFVAAGVAGLGSLVVWLILPAAKPDSDLVTAQGA